MKDSILYNLYRGYYQSEKVFLNQLQIIAKRKKMQEEDNQGDWISIGNKNQKGKKQKSSQIKYNFLDDEKCIHFLIQ